MAQNKQGKQGKITFQVPFNLAEPQEKEGYIHKRGKGLGGKGYTPRYFILSGDVLYYFENKPKNGKAEYCGHINLKGAQLSDVEEPKYPNSFSITPAPASGESARQFWLRTDTPLQKKEWLLYLTKKVKGTIHLTGEDRKYAMTHEDVISGLKRMYQEKMEHIERRFQWDEFFGPLLRKSDFEALPQVLLLGQYSVGKTTFVEYLLHRSFPGARIGPEPTTDRFTALMYADEERIIPGNALSVDPDKPFQAVNKFGSGFLSKFEAACVPSDMLRKVTLIDTPGVLSGEKQRIGRDYDFPAVVRQFADTAHVILLLFDAHKLDISDEFKDVINALHDNKEKIRIVLNKCDQVTTQQLIRIYGSLMWSLGKVINTPEVMRVYLGSFWDRPYKNKENEALFRREQQDLLDDLNKLPGEATTRKVNEMVKRARTLRAHMLVLDHLRQQMPMFGAEEKKAKLIANITKIYEDIAFSRKIPVGDFPNPVPYAKALEKQDFKKFKELSPKMMQEIEEILTRDLPRFMRLTVPETDPNAEDTLNPFSDLAAWSWGVPESFAQEAGERWSSLSPDNAPLGGAALKEPLLQTGAPGGHLKKIWALCDMERSGKLDREEFILALWLSEQAKNGVAPPDTLPEPLIPPSKRSKDLFRDRR